MIQQVRQAQRQVTVGDTVTLVQRVPLPSGAVVQPRALLDSSLVTPIAPPFIQREGNVTRIAYRVAIWAPGRNDLVLPGPVMVTADGKVDTLPDAHIALDVATVLPAGVAPSTVAPRPAGAWIPRGDRSPLPFAVLLGLGVVAAGAVRWWWRRRGRPVPARPAPRAPLPDVARLERWVAQGEAQLALAHVEAIVRDDPRFEEWRRHAEVLRFAPVADDRVAALVREALPRIPVPIP